MRERLQKILSEGGVSSRRAAERLISEGRVTVNGMTAELGQSADLDIDTVMFDGKPVVRQSILYLALNKPLGYVTTMSDEKGRKNVSDLVKGCGVHVYPVGRLDLNSGGLLIMTNDGAAANALMHPSKEVEKTYLVSAAGFSPGAAETLSKSMVIDGKATNPARVEVGKTDGGKTSLLITITQGINRQVRKMCAVAGLEVLSLVRVSVGDIKLGGLPPGQWRVLSEDEINYIRSITEVSKSGVPSDKGARERS